MDSAQSLPKSYRRALVSDFDGTMTEKDFFKLAIEYLIPTDTPNYWEQYRAGKITHFEALRRYFASIDRSQAEVINIVFQMKLDPDLVNAIETLRLNGWRTIIASAGCDWYIRQLLHFANIDVEVHANPGHYEVGNGLIMWLPTESPYFSPEIGISKSAIVLDMLKEYECVAFAGDGFPDEEPAILVPEELRFARKDLAELLAKRKLGYRSFQRWSDIASDLLSRG